MTFRDQEAGQLFLRAWDEVSPYFKEGTGEGLVAAYSQPHRAYHTLVHIGEMLELFEQRRDGLVQPLAIKTFIFWHDETYRVPTVGALAPVADNEHVSAARMFAALNDRTWAPADLAGEMIERTARHDFADVSHPFAGDVNFALDCDLAILASGRGRYAEFEGQIRQEYQAVPHDTYCAGRGAVLNGFLNRDRVYATSDFAEAWSKDACANLRWAVEQLSRGRIPSLDGG